MNWLIALPLEFRLAIVFVLGVLIGAQVNHGVYRLAWDRKNIGPWLPQDRRVPPRQWYDWLPIFGWFTLRRESGLYGKAFWLRPLIVELLMGVGLVLLYWWQVELEGLTPEEISVWGAPPSRLPPQGPWRTHAQFLVHTVLIALMAVASLIDIDEKLIPDQITVLGALGGLLLAVLLPASRLPEWDAFVGSSPAAWNEHTLLLVSSPLPWPPWLDGPRGLAVAAACFAAWWLAVLPPWTWTTRRGLAKAFGYLLVSFRRRLWPRAARPKEGWRGYPVILAAGLMAILACWAFSEVIGPLRWRALVSSLAGMTAGGGIIWAVRIIGTRALGQEAMGFGDVTLVAMIGAFLGWQACLMLFFIAPFIGVVIALGQLVFTGRQDIWYGPFLCLGALLTIVFWAVLWEGWGRHLFGMGLFVPAVLAILLVMMGAMLTIWRFIRERFIFQKEGR